MECGINPVLRLGTHYACKYSVILHQHNCTVLPDKETADILIVRGFFVYYWEGLL